MDSNSRGQIITFYSYKGGTGRSMALANIACILAERQAQSGGKGVLMIDWDLEAPGLHRYFRDLLTSNRTMMMKPFERDDWHDSEPGLIDLLYELDQAIDLNNAQREAEASELTDTPTKTGETLAREVLAEIDPHRFVLQTTVKGLSLLKAGRFSSKDPNEYSERVNKFGWEQLYKKSPTVIRLLAEAFADEYAFVLIDSRTGVTDISGICTMLLPEKLVVVFTPNLQSLKGGLDHIRRATEYRKESADLRPLVVFPLVSRVEANEPYLRHDWRFGTDKIPGYQPEFEKLLAEVYEQSSVRFDKYFDEMQIQHIPRYGYGEEIAVLSEKTGDAFSMRRRYEMFAQKLVEAVAPWEGEIPEASMATRAVSAFSQILTRSRLLPTLAVGVMLVAIIVATLSSIRQTQKAQAMALNLEKARLENRDLEERITQLENPYRTLKDERDRALVDRDKALTELEQINQKLSDSEQKAAQAKLQADRAEENRKQAADTVELYKSDLQNAQSAFNRALAQYNDSQSQVRVLKEQAAQSQNRYQDLQLKYAAVTTDHEKLRSQLRQCCRQD